MADNSQRSVFMPDPASVTEGPFTEALQPPTNPQPQPTLGAGGGKALGAAYIGTQFLQGLSQSRIRNFQMQENAKVQKLQRLHTFLQSIYANSQLTDEAKDGVAQQIMKAMGTDISSQTGKGGKGGQDKDQPQGVAHHFANIIKEVALGAAGGKLPKGVKNVDADAVIGKIQGTLFGPDDKPFPQFSKEGQISGSFTEAQKALQALPPGATQEEALRAIAGSMQKVDRYDPQRGKSMRSDLLSQYQPAPQTGSPEYYLQQGIKSMGGTAQPPTPGGAEQPGIATPKMNAQSLSAFIQSGNAREQDISYQDAKGNRQPIKAFQVNLPGKGTFWYTQDSQGNPVQLDPSKVSRYETETKQKTTEDRAFEAYHQNHKLSPDAKLDANQEIDAIREASERAMTTDQKEAKELQMLMKREQYRAIRNRTANAQNVAEGIMSGIIPPVFMRRYPQDAALEISSYLEKKGFDLKKAELDYLGVEQWVRTLNSQKVTQVRQATGFAMDGLSTLDKLNEQASKLVPRSKDYPIFNAAALTYAKQGGAGISTEAQNAATLLDNQVTELRSVLAAVYMGGSSPTDKALKQAIDILNSNWTESQLRAAVNLARNNLGLRLNNIRTTGPIGVGGELPGYTGSKIPSVPGSDPAEIGLK